jgi:hypothetical protein
MPQQFPQGMDVEREMLDRTIAAFRPQVKPQSVLNVLIQQLDDELTKLHQPDPPKIVLVDHGMVRKPQPGWFLLPEPEPLRMTPNVMRSLMPRKIGD